MSHISHAKHNDILPVCEGSLSRNLLGFLSFTNTVCFHATGSCKLKMPLTMAHSSPHLQELWPLLNSWGLRIPQFGRMTAGEPMPASKALVSSSFSSRDIWTLHCYQDRVLLLSLTAFEIMLLRSVKLSPAQSRCCSPLINFQCT